MSKPPENIKQTSQPSLPRIHAVWHRRIEHNAQLIYGPGRYYTVFEYHVSGNIGCRVFLCCTGDYKEYIKLVRSTDKKFDAMEEAEKTMEEDLLLRLENLRGSKSVMCGDREEMEMENLTRNNEVMEMCMKLSAIMKVKNEKKLQEGLRKRGGGEEATEREIQGESVNDEETVSGHVPGDGGNSQDFDEREDRGKEKRDKKCVVS